MLSRNFHSRHRPTQKRVKAFGQSGQCCLFVVWMQHRYQQVIIPTVLARLSLRGPLNPPITPQYDPLGPQNQQDRESTFPYTTRYRVHRKIHVILKNIDSRPILSLASFPAGSRTAFVILGHGILSWDSPLPTLEEHDYGLSRHERTFDDQLFETPPSWTCLDVITDRVTPSWPRPTGFPTFPPLW